LVVGSSTLLATLPMSVKTVALNNATNNIQNGAPDALGILDVASSMLFDALSYEGSVTMGSVMGAGTLNFVEGNPTTISDSNTAAGSFIRDPNGVDSDDAASDWAFSSTITPGAANIP
jgi:hypothetical protein